VHAVPLVLRAVCEAELRVGRDDRDHAQVADHLQQARARPALTHIALMYTHYDSLQQSPAYVQPWLSQSASKEPPVRLNSGAGIRETTGLISAQAVLLAAAPADNTSMIEVCRVSGCRLTCTHLGPVVLPAAQDGDAELRALPVVRVGVLAHCMHVGLVPAR